MNELIIDKNDLLFNINEVKSKITKENYTLIGVVKGNGYGLDIVRFTNFLYENGISFFAVASVKEALTLRNAGLTAKIMILTPFTDRIIVKELIDNNIIQKNQHMLQMKLQHFKIQKLLHTLKLIQDFQDLVLIIQKMKKLSHVLNHVI